jgi:hypothetical protein
MNNVNLVASEKAYQAFADHKLVRILKHNDQLLEPGYIIIMYGDIAFRIQPKYLQHDSFFVRLAEIKDILFEEI